MEARARSDMDGTSSGPHQVSDQTQFNLFMEYACDGIADVTLYFQFKMNCSWLSQWAKVSGFLSLLQVHHVTMSWLVHQLFPWPVTGLCDFLPWMVRTFSPLSSSLTFFFFFSLRWPFLWLSNKVKVAQMCLVHLWLHYLCKQVPRDVMSYPQLWKGAPSGDGPCRSATIHLFSMVLPISALAQTSTQDT